MRRTSILILLLCGLAHAATAAGTATPERWAGELICGHGKGRFASERTLTLEGGALRFTDDDGSERWDGVLDGDGYAYLHGHYIWDRKKPLFFLGRQTGDRLALQGWRGPKRCVFEGRRETALKQRDRAVGPQQALKQRDRAVGRHTVAMVKGELR